MEDRVDELPLVENDLVARLRHGGGDFIGVLRRLVPPVALGLVPGNPGLAAGIVGAQIRVGMVEGRALVQGIGTAATAWAFRASWEKEAGISAATTPHKYWFKSISVT